MEQATFYYIIILVLAALCILLVASAVIVIYNARQIRKNLERIWQNSEPFQMAQAYEFMGEKSRAVQCYKETLFNVLHKNFRIPGMSKKLQVDYLESKILALGGELPEEL